jgi:hypothetical protein
LDLLAHFVDVGEAKDLGECVDVPFAKGALGRGETRELVLKKAKKKQREAEKWSRGQTGEGFAGGHRRVGADSSQSIVQHYLSTVNRYV